MRVSSPCLQAWERLEKAEHERELALRNELIRQEKLEQLARRFDRKAAMRETWLSENQRLVSQVPLSEILVWLKWFPWVITGYSSCKEIISYLCLIFLHLCIFMCIVCVHKCIFRLYVLYVLSFIWDIPSLNLSSVLRRYWCGSIYPPSRFSLPE